MHWIYLSPHLDDVALSCGGLVWEQSQAGEQVEVWTVCAGDPPPGPLSPFAEELHRRWKTGPEAAQPRREEDKRSLEFLGASPRHFPLPDCIYRRAADGRALFPCVPVYYPPLSPPPFPLPSPKMS